MKWLSGLHSGRAQPASHTESCESCGLGCTCSTCSRGCIHLSLSQTWGCGEPLSVMVLVPPLTHLSFWRFGYWQWACCYPITMKNEGLTSVGLDTITESHQFTGLVTLLLFVCLFVFSSTNYSVVILSHVGFSFWLNEYYDILSGVCH